MNEDNKKRDDHIDIKFDLSHKRISGEGSGSANDLIKVIIAFAILILIVGALIALNNRFSPDAGTGTASEPKSVAECHAAYGQDPEELTKCLHAAEN